MYLLIHCCQSLPHRNLHRSLRMYLHQQNPLNLQKYPQILQSPKNPDCPKSLPHRNLYLLHNHQNSLPHPVPVPLPPLLRPVPVLLLWLLFPLLPAAQAEQCCYPHYWFLQSVLLLLPGLRWSDLHRKICCHLCLLQDSGLPAVWLLSLQEADQ